MATAVPFLFFSFFFLSLHSSSSSSLPSPCRATRFPNLCSPPSNSSTSAPDLIASAISLSSLNLHRAQEMVTSILHSSSGNPNRTTTAMTCLEVLDNSDYRTGMAADALRRGGPAAVKDARAWLSAALVYQYACWSGLKYVNDTAMVNETMAFLNTLTMITSNALSMVMSYDVYGNDMSMWKPPATERAGFWEDGVSGTSGSSYLGSFPTGLTPDVVVCKEGGGGCYTTIQEAVDAAPDNLPTGKKFVVKINEGVYDEIVRVPREKKNVVFLGDGIGRTVITGSLNAGQVGVTTYTSATVGVLGDGFMASGITIQNTAGPDAHQAVAFRSDSDLSMLENCELLGNQDTLYADTLRQYYKSCRIEGNVDFIFGMSASFFENCTILVRPRQLKPDKGENNAVTAHGRTDPAMTTGFVFHNCLINGTDDYMALYRSKPQVHKNYLGRPWKEYSRTVFIGCILESIITPQGWMPWNGEFALKTLYYGEFGNSGPGSDMSGRVKWSSRIPAEHANAYSIQNFIQGDEWIPTSA